MMTKLIFKDQKTKREWKGGAIVDLSSVSNLTGWSNHQVLSTWAVLGGQSHPRHIAALVKGLPLFYLFFKKFYCYSITVVCLFSPSLHPTLAEPTSLPHLHPPPWLCPCVLYSSSCNPLSSLSPPHSPLAIVRLFLTSHNGILCSREKEGAYTLCNSMDGTGEHYAKWNKPGGEGQIPYDLTFNWNIINRRKKQTKYNQRHWS